MALKFHPDKGTILMCTFPEWHEPPEMVKTRPVVVITPSIKGRGKIVTVAAISTQRPDPVMDYHMQLPKLMMPKGHFFQGKESWLKGDMVYSVGFERLDRVQLPRPRGQSKRVYHAQVLDLATLNRVTACVLHGLGQARLVPHLLPQK